MPFANRLVALVLLVLLSGCAASADAAYLTEIESWHAGREERLSSPTGYLALVGLSWIGAGRHTLGSDPESDVQLPPGRAPLHVGEIVVSGESARFVAAAGHSATLDGESHTEVELRADTHELGRTTLQVGDVSFWLIRRGPRLGVRVRDAESELRRNYSGTERFAVDPNWRVEARFVPFVVPRSVSIPSIHGVSSNELLAGELQFEINGKSHALLPLPEDDGSYWLIFSDATSGSETYRGGRFLVTSIPDESGRLFIDFNRAYNPPCAYSSFTTCPLPPQGNQLSVAVRAGERAPESSSAH